MHMKNKKKQANLIQFNLNDEENEYRKVKKINFI